MIINVTFAGTWITNLLTREQLHLLKKTRDETDGLGGQITPYAGRNTIETTTVITRTSALTFARVPGSQVEILRSWRGLPMLMRDGDGWRRTGTFFQINPANYIPGVDLHTVALTWEDSTYNLAV